MMDKRVFLAAGVGLAAAAFGAMGFSSRAAAKNVTLEAPSGADLAADAGTLLVDIRRPEEWRASGVIDGALLVTYTSPKAFLDAVKPRLGDGQRLALICRTGNRTSRAARQIADMLDAPIVDVKGGMQRVLAEGYRSVKPTREMGCLVC